MPAGRSRCLDVRVSIELLSALSDRRRLAVLGALCAANPPLTVADLATHTGLPERDVQRALAVLGGARLVATGPDGIGADLGPMRAATEAAVTTTPIGRLAASYPRLGGCLKNGRVAAIPADHDLEDELGRLIAEALPLRASYAEPELTALLADIGDEPVILRRLLVDTGHLEREPDGSRYWRP